MKEGKYFTFEFNQGIGIFTLNRPPHNICEEGFYYELDEFEKYLDEQEGIRCMVVKANGKNFSAGIDLNFLKTMDSDFALRRLPWLQKIYSYWQSQNYPVIAAIQGLCIGSGCEFILGTDIRIAAENARLALPEVSLGLSPDMGGTSRLTRLVGIGQAKRLLITCDQIDAKEALRIGLVELIVPLEELEEKAMEMARKIASMPEPAVRFAKKGVNLADESGLNAGLLFEQAQSTFCCGTEEKNSALRAYMKRVLGK